MQRMTALFSAALLATGLMAGTAHAQQADGQAQDPMATQQAPTQDFLISSYSSSPMLLKNRRDLARVHTASAGSRRRSRTTGSNALKLNDRMIESRRR